jgi:histidinol-phosphate/aromatic aminotransferase/cobyric acid decarboxylase-like protein
LTFDHLTHGGQTRTIAAASGIPETHILDYSANINPFGPPPWLHEAVAEAVSRIAAYPDPDAREACIAASERFGIPHERFLFADGADSLIFALPRALESSACIVATPTYSGYRRAIARAGLPEIAIPLSPDADFRMDDSRFLEALQHELSAHAAANRRSGHPPAGQEYGDARRALVFLGAPNNPAGGALPRAAVEDLAREFSGHTFIIDESFLELTLDVESLIGSELPNILVVRSLTKAWSVPGARTGFISGKPKLLASVRAELPAWPVSAFAEAIAVRALRDRGFLDATVPPLLAEMKRFARALADLPGIRVIASGANFLLLDFGTAARAEHVEALLLSEGIAIRRFSMNEGLGRQYVRIAVRSPSDNARFLTALASVLEKAPERAHEPQHDTGAKP